MKSYLNSSIVSQSHRYYKLFIIVDFNSHFTVFIFLRHPVIFMKYASVLESLAMNTDMKIIEVIIRDIQFIMSNLS